MMIPESLTKQIEKILDQPFREGNIVSGGSINQTAKICMENGRIYFLKWNSSAPADMFNREQSGLTLLQSSKSGLRIPDVAGIGSTSNNLDFIILEYIEEGSANFDSDRQLGEGLAALHQTTADNFGLDYDNYIGYLPQSNTKHKHWVDFFIQERLQPQLKVARDAGKFSADTVTRFQHLYDKLDDMLVEEPSSLLHGDLWGGNYFFDKKGEPAIFDPAVYYGSREIEIAFTYLFGGFSKGFYTAYQHVFPLQPHFEERKDIYNLYPLLVHTNLFGGSYALRVKSIVHPF